MNIHQREGTSNRRNKCMILNPEYHIKITLNGENIDAEIISDENSIVLKFETSEKKRIRKNILVISRSDL